MQANLNTLRNEITFSYVEKMAEKRSKMESEGATKRKLSGFDRKAKSEFAKLEAHIRRKNALRRTYG